MFLALLLLTLCLHAMACPRWLSRAWVVKYGGAATRPHPLAPYRSHPVLVTAVMAAAPAPATPPLRRPQGPDPLPGRRVYIRPQPMRAPRDEVMALGPLRGREPARAVAGGPTPEWGGGGMAWGTAAAAMRLPLAPGMTGTVARDSPPSPPPLGRSSVRGADMRRIPSNRGARGMGCAAAGGDGEPTPPPADPSAQPGRGAVHGTGRQRVPPNQGALGVGCATAEGDSGPMPTPTDAGGQTSRGASRGAPNRPPDTLPAAPRANTRGNGGGLSTGGFPLGMGLGPGPSMRQEGVYTSTAQEGAPRQGDGSGPLSVGGLCTGGGKGLHTGVGRLRDGMGPSRRGAAAVPRAGRSQGRVKEPPTLPPPPPKRTAAAGGADRVHWLTGDRLGWTPRRHEAAPPPPPSDHCPGPPATCRGPPVSCHQLFLPMARGPLGRQRGRGRGRGRGHAAPAPPLPWHRRRHHGLALLRWWHTQSTLVFPAPHQRRGWASTVCAVAPLVELCPGVLRLQDLLAEA